MKIKKEIKVGFVFVVALAVLVWGLMYLKGLDIFKHKTTVFAVYDKVDGLMVANAVSISGMQVGQVSKLSFSKTERGKIIAEFIISEDYPIPIDSKARIFSSSLIGAKGVEIIPGTSKEIVRDGDTLNALIDASLGEEVNKQLGPLKKKAEDLISSIDTVANIVKEILNQKTRDNLVASIDNIKITLQHLAHVSSSLDTLFGKQGKHLAGIISNVESISNNLKNNNEKISNILSNFSNLSDSITRAKIPSTFNQINKAVADLSTIIGKINSGEGSASQLINNRQLYNEVEKAAHDLNLLLEDIKANPKKYVKVSVF